MVVTRRADSLRRGDMVMIWVFVDAIFEVMMRPARMLP